MLESARGYPQSRGTPRHHLNSILHTQSTSDEERIARTRQNGVQRAYSSQNNLLNFEICGSSTKPFANGNNTTNVNGHDHDHSDKYNFHDTKGPERVFLLSAFDEVSGNFQAKNLKRYLEDRLSFTDGNFLDDLAYTLATRRSRLGWKVAIYANSAASLIEKLGDPKLRFQKSTAEPELAFAFTGQGANWPAMGRELIKTYSTFAKSLIKAGTCLKAIGSDWNLLGMAHSWPERVSTEQLKRRTLKE